MNSQFTPAERLAIHGLVDDLLDANDATYPLPPERRIQSNDKIGEYGSPIFYRNLTVPIVTAESLTSKQKDDIGESLQIVGELCLQRTMKLKQAEIKSIVEHAERFLRHGQIKL